MRTQYLAAIAIAAVAAGAGWAAYAVRTADYCPQPSATSAAALFAPCQSFDVAMGHAVTKAEAEHMGLPTPAPGPASAPAERPAPTPAQLVAQEHSTVGLAVPKRAH